MSRLDSLAPDDVATSIVSFQKEVQGWLAYLNNARTPEQIINAYEKLEELLRWFQRMNVLPFGMDAQARYGNLRPYCRRVRTMDLRIASIALETGATLLSRNLRDFRQMPGLVVEDWTG